MRPSLGTLLVVAIAVVLAWAAPPECSNACDDPIAHAVCTARCRPPACEVLCNTTNTTSILDASHISCGRPRCWTNCSEADPDLATESCPTCATNCDPPTCVYRGTLNFTAGDYCEIQCEEPQCGWDCVQPEEYQKPACELLCDVPACAHQPEPAPPSPTAGHGGRVGKKRIVNTKS